MHTSANQPDYAAITEMPGSGLSQEQFTRIVHRYHLAADLARGRRVLEVACGAGIGLGLLQRRAAQLFAIDYSSTVLQRAHSHYGDRMPLVHADAQHLPFASATLDVVLCFEAIYYLADFRHFLAECRRILAPNGWLLISTSNPDWPDFVPGPFTTHYPSAQDLSAALAQVGFQDIQIHGILSSAALSTVDRWRNRLRSLVMKNTLLAQTLSHSALLKKLAYRGLVPLVHELSEADLTVSLPMSPLSAQRRDQRHRVHYFHAQVMA